MNRCLFHVDKDFGSVRLNKVFLSLTKGFEDRRFFALGCLEVSVLSRFGERGFPFLNRFLITPHLDLSLVAIDVHTAKTTPMKIGDVLLIGVEVRRT